MVDLKNECGNMYRDLAEWSDSEDVLEFGKYVNDISEGSGVENPMGVLQGLMGLIIEHSDCSSDNLVYLHQLSHLLDQSQMDTNTFWAGKSENRGNLYRSNMQNVLRGLIGKLEVEYRDRVNYSGGVVTDGVISDVRDVIDRGYIINDSTDGTSRERHSLDTCQSDGIQSLVDELTVKS